MVVEQAKGRWGLHRFVGLPYSLYRGDPCWAPPLRYERKQFLSSRHNPFFDHADVALWLAKRQGRVVGRVSSQIDHLHNERHNEKLASFGFFECERDPEVAAALIASAARWGRERGATALRGPLSFSLNHESGLLVDGFDEPPVLGMPYNPPWYAELLEQSGLVKERDLLGARAEMGPAFAGMTSLPDEITRVADGMKTLTGVRVSHVRREDRATELPRLISVYNQAWAGNWGFVPLTPAEAQALRRDLEPVLDDGLSLLAEANGAPVGVLLGIRDLNQLLVRLHGRLLPLGWATLLRGIRRIDTCRLVLFGVLEAYRGLGVGTLLVVEALRAGIAAGYRRVEMGWILESNQALLRPLLAAGQHLGVRLHRRWRIFRLPLTG